MKKARKIIIFTLAFFIAMNISVYTAGSENVGNAATIPDSMAIIKEKNEAVYARLSGLGEVQSIYIVNQFSFQNAGVFTDYGNYDSIINLTDLEPLAIANGEVSIRTGNDNFFYQGDLIDNSLPWIYNVEYYMDGYLTSPDELVGKSGSLEIRLASIKNDAANDMFYNNYMQQISLTLDTNKCANITATGAAAANAGINRVLSFTVMPGVDAEISVTADVRDFEMAGIEIAAMPFVMDIEPPDTSNMLDGIIQLSGYIQVLGEGADSLKDGMAELMANYAEFQIGFGAYAQGIIEMQSALGDLAYGIENFNMGIAEIYGGMAEIYGGMAYLHEGISQLANETSGMPGQFQYEIDNMLNEYMGGEFEPVSFASDKNVNIGLVQFAFMTDGIVKTGEISSSQTNEGHESFWTRLIKLFK